MWTVTSQNTTEGKVEVLYPVETWPPLTIPKLRQIKGGQALHNAASRNNSKRALALIRGGTPVDAADDSGANPARASII